MRSTQILLTPDEKEEAISESFSDQIKDMLECLEDAKKPAEVQRYYIENFITNTAKQATLEQTVQIAIFLYNPSSEARPTNEKLKSLFSHCQTFFSVDRWDRLKVQLQQIQAAKINYSACENKR